ncbi:glycosyltransferase family 4 protein [Alcaligenes sp. SDU_A2]|uniref:glycosyltransferase family 4 protein n=1 Tax=Alcaligenes sp. SDU_A2 TaxID=3136634 RepID=UPI00311FAD22
MSDTPPFADPVSQRLRIAFVVDRFGNRFGGAEAYGVELMRELSRHHDITVFARDYDSRCDLKLPFVPIRHWSRWPGWVRSWLFARKAAQATAQGFDIVHSHMNGWCGDVEVVHVTPVRYNWRVRSLPWLKKLGSYISPRVAMYLHLEGRRLRAGSQAVVAVSGLIAEQLQQAYGDVHPYPVIAPGVLLPQADGQEQQREQTRAALGLETGQIVCLLVARNPIRKGLATVLAALAQMPSHYRLLVVGGKPSLRDDMRRQLLGQGLEDRVVLVGETSNVEPYYRAADIYVHPTLNDSFGMAPLEAMSYGLPVVLSPSPWCGFAQYVRAGHHAVLLSHPENAAELADAVQRLGADPAAARHLVENSRQLLAQFSWPSVAARYQALYQQVLQRR